MLSQAQTTALPAPVQMLALPAANTTLKKEPVIPLFSGISQAIPLLRADIKIEIPEAARNNKNVTPEILKNITKDLSINKLSFSRRKKGAHRASLLHLIF